MNTVGVKECFCDNHSPVIIFFSYLDISGTPCIVLLIFFFLQSAISRGQQRATRSPRFYRGLLEDDLDNDPCDPGRF